MSAFVNIDKGPANKIEIKLVNTFIYLFIEKDQRSAILQYRS